MISIDDFKKVEIRAGKVLTALPVEGSEKLLKLSVDFGLKPQSGSPEDSENVTEGKEIRQVVSGIAKHISPEDLVGTICAFVTNLEPREIMGLKSEAMIMAVSGENENGSFFSLLKIAGDTPPGSLVK